MLNFGTDISLLNIFPFIKLNIPDVYITIWNLNFYKACKQLLFTNDLPQDVQESLAWLHAFAEVSHDSACRLCLPTSINLCRKPPRRPAWGPPATSPKGSPPESVLASALGGAAGKVYSSIACPSRKCKDILRSTTADKSDHLMGCNHIKDIVINTSTGCLGVVWSIYWILNKFSKHWFLTNIGQTYIHIHQI